jgi:tetratricopeptide (TPR) repeat protein
LGILACRQARYEEAEKYLATAVARATHNYTRPKDCEAMYYLGVALRGQGKERDAEDAFHKAAWDLAWTGAANVALAESACRKRDFGRALDFIDRALAVGAMNTKALGLKIALLRRLGRFGQAMDLAQQAREIDPLDAWASHESSLLGSGISGPPPLAEVLGNDVQAFLELAVDYGNCGMYDEAINVLQKAIAASPNNGQIDPMVNYHLGYYRLREGKLQQARECFRLASDTSPDYCFPYRLESIGVLRAAMAHNPGDARAACYLGNLVVDIQPEAAIDAWERARAIDGKWAIVHRNLGWGYAHVRHDAAKAVVSLETAVACDGEDPRFYTELDTLYDVANADLQKRLEVLERNHETVALRDDALLREIRLLILVHRYDRALELLQNHHFRVWEGETGVHDIYADALSLRGRESLASGNYASARKDFEAALEYPERFETAKAGRNQGRFAEIQYFLGLVSDAEGRVERSRHHFELAAEGAAYSPAMRYYQALAEQKLGHGSKAERLFDGLIRLGQERLRATDGLDFFAKFGAQQSAAARKADAYWFKGLGLLGKGRRNEAREQFEAALQSNASHLGARTMMAELSLRK